MLENDKERICIQMLTSPSAMASSSSSSCDFPSKILEPLPSIRFCWSSLLPSLNSNTCVSLLSRLMWGCLFPKKWQNPVINNIVAIPLFRNSSEETLHFEVQSKQISWSKICRPKKNKPINVHRLYSLQSWPPGSSSSSHVETFRWHPLHHSRRLSLHNWVQAHWVVESRGSSIRTEGYAATGRGRSGPMCWSSQQCATSHHTSLLEKDQLFLSPVHSTKLFPQNPPHKL